MRVLVAEDEAVSRRLLEHLLVKWGYEVQTVCDGEEAWRVLRQSDSPRVAILDWMMPGMDGIDVCRKVRALEGQAYVYIILLTAKGRVEDMVEGLDAGADDYIRKPFDSHELHARLRAGRRIQELQSQLISAQEELRLRAIYDPLTGLFNRGAILDAIGVEMSRSRRHGSTFSIVMADLDHFKGINDYQGHNIGDRVLMETASRLRSSCREHDVIGRYGGDEFLVCLPETSPDEAVVVADRMRSAMCDQLFVVGDVSLKLSASFGVAQAVVTGDESIEMMIERADMAAYEAKAGGRNCIRSDGSLDCMCYMDSIADAA